MTTEEFELFQSKVVTAFLKAGPARQAVIHAIGLLPGSQEKIIKEGLEYCGRQLTTYKTTTISVMRGAAGQDIYVMIYYWLFKTKHDTEYKKNIDRAVFGRVVTLGDALGTIPSAPFKWPAYVLKQEAKNADKELKEGRGEATWLNPHNHYSIPLEGRKREIEILDDFIKKDAPFLKTFIIAPSGAGKTRLVSQWMRKLVADPSAEREGFEKRIEGWDAGFVESRKKEPWEDWQPTSDTLIVIDYTYNYDDVIKAIADKAKQNHGFKIRLLILDHVKPSENSIAYAKAEGGAANRGTAGDFLSEKLEHATIELQPDEYTDKLLAAIIARVASLFTGDKAFPEDDPRILEATKALVNMATSDDDEDEHHNRQNASRHPLFAALMGQAIGINPESNIAHLRRRDLIDLYFAPARRIPWHPDKEINPYGNTLGPWIGSFISIATLVRGVSFDELFSHLPKGFAGEMRVKEAKKIIREISNNIVSGSDNETLKPFEPDILGESFFLKFLDDLNEEHDFMQFIFDVIQHLHDKDKDAEIASNIIETFKRLIRNIIKYDKYYDIYEVFFINISKFLNASNYTKSENFLGIIFIIISDIIDQIRLNNKDEYLLKYFVNAIFCDMINNFSDQRFWFDIIESVLKILEMDFHSRWLSDEERHEYLVMIQIVRHFNKDKKNEIILASENGLVNICKYLIEKSPNELNYRTSISKLTALSVACFFDRHLLVDFLLERKAMLDFNEKEITPLIASCLQNNIKIVSRLLEESPDVNCVLEGDNATPLYIASALGYSEIVKLLIDAGADQKIYNSIEKLAPIHIASKLGHLHVVEILANDIEAIDLPVKADSGTAIHLSIINENYEITKLLSEKGANLNLTATEMEIDAVSLVMVNNNFDLFKDLIESPCYKIDLQNSFGATALHIASLFSKIEFVNVLIYSGADPTIRDQEDRTPADIALYDADNQELHNLLKQAEAEWIAKHGDQKSNS